MWNWLPCKVHGNVVCGMLVAVAVISYCRFFVYAVELRIPLFFIHSNASSYDLLSFLASM
jgi:hypothetical protein